MAVGTHFGMYDFPFYNIHNTEYYPVFILRLVKALLDLSRKHEIDLSFFTTWAFYAEGKRLFEGNRALFTNFGIPLPVFNAFRILEKLGETRIALNLGEPCRMGTALPPPLVDGLASLSNGRSVTVLLWNSAENPETQKEAWISLSVANLPFDVQSGDVVMYRLDRDHGNAHATWCRIGAPEDPTPDQLKRIRESASCVPVRPEKPPRVRDRSINWRIRLPGPGAVLIHIGRRRSRFISL
jgi:xylan 1,4-beta-xylosidase